MAKRKPAVRTDKSFQKVTDEQIAQAFHAARGMVTSAARALGVSPRTVYYRLEQNEELVAQLKESREINKDLAEVALFKAIERGEAWAVCFYLKTQAKDRGYVEKAELNVDVEGRIESTSQGPTAGEVVIELLKQPGFAKFARAAAEDRNARMLRDERKHSQGANGS